MRSVVHRAAGGQLRRLKSRELWRRWRERRRLARARALVPSILGAIPSSVGHGSLPRGWRIHRAELTFMGTVVITVGPRRQQATAVLKLPQTAYGLAGLREQKRVLDELHADSRLDGWSTLLPRLLADGEIAGQVYVVEEALPGRDARALLCDPESRARVHTAAAAAIGQLHQRMAIPAVADGAMLARWVDRPLLLIRRLLEKQPQLGSNDVAMERLAVELRATLAGRTVGLSWIHGDYWAGNILVASDRATVTGIVDWDWATHNQLPLLDLLNLLLTTRRLVTGRQLGEVVCTLLERAEWTTHERVLLSATGETLLGKASGGRAMILLCWLRHVVGHLTKSTGHADDPPWVAANVANVLRYFA